MTSSSPTCQWLARHDDVVIALALVTDAQSEKPAGDERAQTQGNASWRYEQCTIFGKAKERVLSANVSRLESRSASIGPNKPACRPGG